MNDLDPPPSMVELIKENSGADSTWKKWFNNFYQWALENMSKDFFFEVSAGNVAGHTPVSVVGHDSTIGNILATVGNNTGILQTYSTTEDIDSISSDNAADVHDVVITGLDIDYNPVAAQIVTLSGQNRVAIPISLFRICEITNANGAATAGTIWVYVNTAIVSGKPTDLSKIRSSIHRTNAPSGSNVSYEHHTGSNYTIPAGKTAYVVFGKTTVSDAKAMDLSFWGSVEGGPFRILHPISLKDNYF